MPGCQLVCKLLTKKKIWKQKVYIFIIFLNQMLKYMHKKVNQ